MSRDQRPEPGTDESLFVPIVSWSGSVATLDTQHQGVPGTVAVYLARGLDGRFVLIEAGPGSTTQAVERHIAAAGLEPEGLEAVFVTHVHLDHAGGAGALAAGRGVPVYVHERGARHLIDPSRLMASAQRVFGERTNELWGKMVPVPAQQVRILPDGAEVATSAGTFRAVETPGHARHHLSYLLADGSLFAGDAVAIRLPHSDVIAPAMPPPELDLEAWGATITRLAELNPARLFLTHFGEVQEPMEHLLAVRELHAEVAEVARSLVTRGAGGEIAAFLEQHLTMRLRDVGADAELVRRYLTASPPEVSAMGLKLYFEAG